MNSVRASVSFKNAFPQVLGLLLQTACWPSATITLSARYAFSFNSFVDEKYLSLMSETSTNPQTMALMTDNVISRVEQQ